MSRYSCNRKCWTCSVGEESVHLRSLRYIFEALRRCRMQIPFSPMESGRGPRACIDTHRGCRALMVLCELSACAAPPSTLPNWLGRRRSRTSPIRWRLCPGPTLPSTTVMMSEKARSLRSSETRKMGACSCNGGHACPRWRPLKLRAPSSLPPQHNVAVCRVPEPGSLSVSCILLHCRGR